MPNRAAILTSKFQDSIALPFEQVLPEAVIQQVLEEQGVSYRGYAVHADCGGVGMDVASPRLGQKFKQCRQPSHCLGAPQPESRFPTPIPEAIAKLAFLLPLSVLKPLFKRTAETLLFGGEAGATVVRAAVVLAYDGTGRDDERYPRQPKALSAT